MERVEHASLQIVPVSPAATDRFRLSDPYVEEVWSEFLGPTATLLARRLGRLVEQRPGGVEVELGELAVSLGVAPSIATKALERLHRFEVVHCDLDRGIVGVSGYAPLVGDGRVSRLSEAGRVAHEQLTATLDDLRPQPGRASEMLGLTGADHAAPLRVPTLSTR